MRKTSIALAVLSLSMIWATADAGQQGRHGAKAPAKKALVKAADADQSGDVTADEWQAFLDGLTVDESGAVDLAALLSTLADAFPERSSRPRYRHHGRSARGGADVDTGTDAETESRMRAEILGRVLDADADGAVTVTEVDAVFEALDRDGDGALSDADRRGRMRHMRPMGHRARRAGRFILTLADADESGDVSADEWATFKDSLGADENGVFDAATLIDLLPEPEEGSRLADKTGEERAERLTRVVDRDRDDVLELSDLDTIYERLDRDDDGALSADELAKQKAV